MNAETSAKYSFISKIFIKSEMCTSNMIKDIDG